MVNGISSMVSSGDGIVTNLGYPFCVVSVICNLHPRDCNCVSFETSSVRPWFDCNAGVGREMDIEVSIALKRVFR